MMHDVKQGLGTPADGSKPQPSGWVAAAGLVERWLARSERVDALLEGLASNLGGQERARAQHLFYGVVRWASRLEAALAGLMTRPPRTKVRAVLMIAGFEMLEQSAEGKAAGGVAKVIHHAVERAKGVCSPKEAGLVNAVARKMAGRLAEDGGQTSHGAGRATGPGLAPASIGKTEENVELLAIRWAHPEWLVARWVRQFGVDTTRKLLEWNQQPAPVYARWRADTPVATFLAPTKWVGFYEVKAGHWEDVRRLANEGALYLQDPSTRLCLELLAPQAGETILDACAAPGGKSLFIADTMATHPGAGRHASPAGTLGKLVALDEPAKPGKPDLRLQRLKENLARAPAGVEVAMVEADLARVNTVFYRNLNLPESYDAVLLDAPCSNTGVMRHRIDVKWRLQDGDFARHQQQQLALLHAAARLVRPGGRLVYSTCSIDADENDGVIRGFFDSRAGGPFKLEEQILATPWADGHDGAGAFLLRKH